MVSLGLDNCLQLQHQHHSVKVVTAILRGRAAGMCASKTISTTHTNCYTSTAHQADVTSCCCS